MAFCGRVTSRSVRENTLGLASRERGELEAAEAGEQVLLLSVASALT
jgi:hypothetical protein